MDVTSMLNFATIDIEQLNSYLPNMAALDSHSGDSEEGLNRRGARDLQCPDSLRDGNTGQPLGQNHRLALEADTG